MTNKERVNKFKNEKIAIHCETEEEASLFIKWCYANGFGWDDSPKDITFFDSYKNETCYTFNFTGDNYLEYSCKQFYKKEGYEVIKYKDFMKGEKKMTNLEVAVSKDLIIHNTMMLCMIANVCKYGSGCGLKRCIECEFNENVNLCVQTLLQEHKEPIKLKQWEYDLLKANLNDTINPSFNWYADLCRMKEKGYFKGVTYMSMTLLEILDDCEVVE